MFFRKTRGKEFKMIWSVEKDGSRSFLAGTAHFFPHSFKDSLAIHIQQAETVIFEGPLDDESMAKVARAGEDHQSQSHLFESLDQRTITSIRRALLPASLGGDRFQYMDLRGLKDPAYEMVKGLKPWMAFFTLWTHHLEQQGWKSSVDLEAYRLAREMKKTIVFLETIEEQIGVLEGLPLDRIMDFLKRADRWNTYLRKYVKYYLRGDMEKLLTLSIGFPSRSFTVIERRDEIFFERMRPPLEKGGAIVFVGAPHVNGICRMMTAEGYEVRHHAQRK
jgi:uncharacterized protein YbaP (TraB family)